MSTSAIDPSLFPLRGKLGGKKTTDFFWEISVVTKLGDDIVTHYTDADWSMILEFCRTLLAADYGEDACTAVWILGDPKNAPPAEQGKFEGQDLTLRYVVTK
ncbi:MAG: hypothetical protein JWP09_446 [Candidatus Taylorbacteria bacterium]|nr:hypothetical protein [Candidatus Taylorbacteria bacterium]